MTANSVVRFDAELLVHRTSKPLSCISAVVTREKPYPRAHHGLGTILVVRRCVLPTGHDGDHESIAMHMRPATTACGLSLAPDAWINWTRDDGAPLCATCFDVAADVQEAMAL